MKTPIVRAPFKLLGIVVVLFLIGMLLIGILLGPTSPSPTSQASPAQATPTSIAPDPNGIALTCPVVYPGSGESEDNYLFWSEEGFSKYIVYEEGKLSHAYDIYDKESDSENRHYIFSVAYDSNFDFTERIDDFSLDRQTLELSYRWESAEGLKNEDGSTLTGGFGGDCKMLSNQDAKIVVDNYEKALKQKKEESEAEKDREKREPEENEKKDKL